MRRRAFLAGLAAGALGGCAHAAPERPEGRPNILFAIADDQSWVHTSIGGDPVVRTPVFDRLAREGVLYSNAFCSSPSCTPSRGATLSGQDFWRLREGASLWSSLPASIDVYPDLLEKAGYFVGATRKGWGPGKLEPSDRTRNPAGPRFKNFQTFLDEAPEDGPFCFWFGSVDPHRPYERGSGVKSGKDPVAVNVPPFLPDAQEIREDILDYMVEIERFDREVGEMVALLEERGLLDDTLIVMTSDNGMPFPRAKANIYDYGVHMPLAIRWGNAVSGDRVIDDFVGFPDFAPTLLEAAGEDVPEAMTGRSLLKGLLSGKQGRVEKNRDCAFFGKERHTNLGDDGDMKGVSYPSRGIRTSDYLYIRNFEPDRWPACNPPVYGDIDGNSPTKTWMVAHRDDPEVRRYFDLATAKRPAEELYDLALDPEQLHNVAAEPGYERARKKLWARLEAYLRETGDPRVVGGGEAFDTYPYYGKRPKWAG
ncbi:MAG: sulfatase [bacterium]|nr:sulfatase [bacterium]